MVHIKGVSGIRVINPEAQCIGWLDKRGRPGKKGWQVTGRVSNGEGIFKGEGNKGIEHQKIICDTSRQRELKLIFLNKTQLK